MNIRVWERHSGELWLNPDVLLALASVSFLAQPTDAVRCKICPDGVSSDGYCSKVGDCSGDSVCYTSVTDEGFGQKKVVTGCMSKQVCRNNGIQVKRQVGNQICFDCCDTDMCNSRLCNIALPSGFHECFGCDSVSSPSACDTSKLCTSDQYCMTEYRYTGAQSGTYRMDCESSKMCEKQEQFAVYFNKRDLGEAQAEKSHAGVISSQQELVSVSKRSIDDPSVICLSCCKYPFCNDRENCVFNEKAPPPRTTVTP